MHRFGGACTMASGMVAVAERSEVGGPCLDTENDERVAHIQPAVGIVLGESPIEEPGTLYVTTKYATTRLSLI